MQQSAGLRLAVFTISRLVINTALRFTYPFLPALARGAGVSLVDVSRLVALRGAVGLTSPLFSPLSDRLGRRITLVLALLIFTAGNYAVFLRPTYWMLAIALILTGIAKVIYDPAVMAYLADTVPYQQRGRVFSVLELSWSSALLIGAPLMGLAMQRQGWSAPYAWLGVCGLIATLCLWLVMPRDRPAPHHRPATISRRALLRQEPVIWAVCAYLFMLMGANELLLIVFGSWIESQFALTFTGLGLAAAVIGAAELLGESSSGLAVDRFGKRPVIITTALIVVLGYLLLPLAGSSLGVALGLLFMLFVSFEITIVGGLPLLTETLPQARGVLLSMALAAGSAGRMSGALAGPFVWEQFGLTGVVLAAALITLLGILVLIIWIREAPAGRIAPADMGVSD